MLKIGDFSKLGCVSIKALRLYAELGLLRPAWIDRFTGYRYYQIEQLAVLNRILALKELGFSLDQVSKLVVENLSVEQMRLLLAQRQQEIQQQLEREQLRLVQVEDRLKLIEQEGRLPFLEIVLKPIRPHLVLALHQTLPNGVPTFDFYQRMCQSLKTFLQQRDDLKPVGPWQILHRGKEYSEHGREVEVSIEIESSPALLKQINKGQKNPLRTPPDIPAIYQVTLEEHVACALHQGNVHGLQQTYAQLFLWAAANGYQTHGPMRERFLHTAQDLDCPLAGHAALIEVQMPVERNKSLQNDQTYANQSTKGSRMEPKIIDKPAFMVIGVNYIGKNTNNEVGELWNVFNQREKEIQNIVEQEPYYGICLMLPNAKDGEFEYIAGAPVSKAEHIPTNMVLRMVPARRYAVFTHYGSLETLRKTYENIYQAWVPQSGLQIEGQFDMEVYDERFKFFAPDSEFDIYVPLKP